MESSLSVAAALPASALRTQVRRRKPKLRGWSHLLAFPVALIASAVLISRCSAGRLQLAALVYGATLVGLFGISAAYHRAKWKRRRYRWIARMDHSMIYLFIAGTCTPFGCVLPKPAGTIFLVLAWSGAALGCLKAFVWRRAPKPLTVLTYILLGWLGVGFMPELLHTLGIGVIVWTALGGLLYTLGAMAYAFRRPNPWPEVFGYHEVFHAFVVCAAVCHFVSVTRALRLAH